MVPRAGAPHAGVLRAGAPHAGPFRRARQGGESPARPRSAVCGCWVRSPPPRLLAGAAAFSAAAARARAPTPRAPLQALDWPSFGGDGANDRFSADAALTPATAAQLQPAFRVPLGAPGPREGFPLEAGGVLHVAATGDQVLAVDAVTGRVRWR